VTGGAVEESLATRAGRLFAEYRQGDEAKMADLVRILTPILWHTARASRLDVASAEDVLQTAWLTLVRKADSISEPLAVLQWMVVTTKREAWRVARTQTRIRPEDLEATGGLREDGVEAVEDTVLRAEADSRLWQHIAALPERCRALLRVIAFADRPDYAELAKALGMPQGSIGPTRGRCLAKLRIALAQDPSWEMR
jgi:RNA polymerase sigma factor (sigma-70 family)